MIFNLGMGTATLSNCKLSPFLADAPNRQNYKIKKGTFQTSIRKPIATSLFSSQ